MVEKPLRRGSAECGVGWSLRAALNDWADATGRAHRYGEETSARSTSTVDCSAAIRPCW